MMCATLIDPNQPNHYFTASPVRARARQIRAPKKGILGVRSRGSYWDNVTVYPYNRHIRSTNPIVRHVMSLTCTLKHMRANQHTPKHAATQPLHDSNTRARASNLGTWDVTGAQSMGSCADNVAVNCYNGRTNSTEWIWQPKRATTRAVHIGS